MIKISVVIPVYNAKRHLRECLRSVLNQDIRDIEVICVNDGSTDGSIDVLHDYARWDGRVRVIEQANAGPAAARNAALDIAGGEYIAFMDSDDLYPNDGALAALYDEANSKGILLCGGNMEYFGQGGKSWSESYPPFFGFQSYLFSRKLFSDGTLRFPPYGVFEDPPFLVAAMARAGAVARIDSVVYWYRVAHKSPVDWAGASAEKAKDALRGMIDTAHTARTAELETVMAALNAYCRGNDVRIIAGQLALRDAAALGLLCRLNVEIGGPLLPVLDEIRAAALAGSSCRTCLFRLLWLTKRAIGRYVPDGMKFWR